MNFKKFAITLISVDNKWLQIDFIKLQIGAKEEGAAAEEVSTRRSHLLRPEMFSLPPVRVTKSSPNHSTPSSLRGSSINSPVLWRNLHDVLLKPDPQPPVLCRRELWKESIPEGSGNSPGFAHLEFCFHPCARPSGVWLGTKTKLLSLAPLSLIDILKMNFTNSEEEQKGDE